jgi:hypothetical protein
MVSYVFLNGARRLDLDAIWPHISPRARLKHFLQAWEGVAGHHIKKSCTIIVQGKSMAAQRETMRLLVQDRSYETPWLFPIHV